MSQTSRILASIVMGSIVLGIIMMVVSVSILQEVFWIGLGLFLLGMAISMVVTVCHNAEWMDKQTRKYFD